MYQQAYTVTNATRLGQPLKHLPAFSLEFEVSSCNRRTLEQALILLKFQYKRTSDSSVDDEYKSPIYHSLRAFRKPLAVLDELRGLVNEHCGTHLHVACACKESLAVVHAEAFSPLLDYMLTHPEQTTQFWGRFFSRYATAPNSNRYHCFNLDSVHPTLEFRLPRFRNGEQYLRVIQFSRSVVVYLDKALAYSGQPKQKKHIISPYTMGRHVLALYQQAVSALPEYEPRLNERLIEEEDREEDNLYSDSDDF